MLGIPGEAFIEQVTQDFPSGHKISKSHSSALREYVLHCETIQSIKMIRAKLKETENDQLDRGSDK